MCLCQLGYGPSAESLAVARDYIVGLADVGSDQAVFYR